MSMSNATSDELAPAGTAGRIIRFSKEGEFKTVDDGVEVDQDAMFAVLADQTWHGYMRFNGLGELPTRIRGLVVRGLRVATAGKPAGSRRERLGNQQLYRQARRPVASSFLRRVAERRHDGALHLRHRRDTGKSAVAQLLQHCDRIRDSGDVPVVH